MSQLAAVPPISAVAPWFGSKRTLAPRIVQALGKHSAYWEPFCGSLAVLFAKPVVSMETVNDLHGDLINLCRVLRDEDAAVDLYGRLNRLVMHEDLFTEAATAFRERGHTPATDSPDTSRAENFMVCSWFGRNGVAGTQSYNQGFCARYTKNGGHAAKRWASAVDSIPWWHERLRHVTIMNRDAFGLLERIEDAAGVVIYLDPPYLVKGAKYVHDLAVEDHARLAQAARRFQKTRVVVSYYDHPALDDLYHDWRIERIDVTRSMANQGGKVGADKATEVILINDRGCMF